MQQIIETESLFEIDLGRCRCGDEPVKKIRWYLLIAVLVVVIAGGLWVIANWNELRGFQQMPSRAYAKFMCSTYFVEEMTDEQARNLARGSAPVEEILIDFESKSAMTRSLFYTSTASYVNERYGCT
jgi:hypothetical protein